MKMSSIIVRTILLAAALAVLHELGHVAAMLAWGAGVSKLTLGSPVFASLDIFGVAVELGLPLMGFGAEAVRSVDAMSPLELATIAAAGPLVSLACAFALIRLKAQPWAIELAWGVFWLQAIPWPGIDAFSFLNGVARLFPDGAKGLIFIALIAVTAIVECLLLARYLKSQIRTIKTNKLACAQ